MTNRRSHRTAARTPVIALCAALSIALSAVTLLAGEVVDLALVDVQSISGASAEEQFGYCLASGDFDGDGLAELVVGAPGFADSSGTQHAGAVFVFRADALNALSGDVPAAELAEWVIPGVTDGGRFGSAVASGDFDGDGMDDLAVGAPAAGDGTTTTRGEVSVFFGGSTDTWAAGAVPEVVLAGEVPGARLGTEMLAGDINGDATAELLLAAPGDGPPATPGSGVVYVLTGSALRGAHGLLPVSDIAGAVIAGGNANDGLAGLAVADTDGDGVRELVLGACLADGTGDKLPDAGIIYVVPVVGGLDRLSGPLEESALWSATGPVERGFLGRSMSAGDLDYDGDDELLVSLYGSRAGGEKLEATGEAFIVFGGRGPDDARELALDDPGVPRFTGASRSDMFGLPVLLTDLNGDGSDDVVVAGRQADGPDEKRRACGEVYIYWGSLQSVMAAKAGSAERADVTIIGGAEDDGVGGALLAVRLSPDVPPSLLIGAPNATAAEDEGAPVPRSGKLLLLPGQLLLR